MKFFKISRLISRLLSFCLLFFVTSFLLLIPVVFNASAYTIELSAIVPGCGDGQVTGDEQCDGSNFLGKTCSTYSYNRGVVSCTQTCVINTTGCYTSEDTGGGSNGGGGGTPNPPTLPPPATNVVIFTGMAYPHSVVTLLKDAQVVATTKTDSDAKFQINISSLSSGNYIFSMYSEDHKGIRSALLTFSVGITSGVTTKISNIFIAPSIGVDKDEVKRGENVAIFGQSAPLSEIVISVHSNEEIFKKTIADDNGVYLYNFDTSVLEDGLHYTKSKASAGNSLISGYGSAVSFSVGSSTVIKEEDKPKESKGDLNNDNHVSIVDFSIAAYWYKRPLSEVMKESENRLFNGDGKIDLVDFSILAYFWTG